MGSDGALECPDCGPAPAGADRFCPTCGLPLVMADESGPAPDPRRLVARKIKPQLAEGSLVRVAGARNQAEAEFVQGLLLEEGVPSVLRRTAGFDVPDFLAAGPRDVLVPQSGVAVAREVLLQAEIIGTEAPRSPVRPRALLIWLLVALAAGAALIWVISLLVK